MEPADRSVTVLPLPELWDEVGSVEAEPLRPVGRDAIRELLQRDERLRFVVAEVGAPLRWVGHEARFHFWKDELAAHLVEPEKADHGFALSDLPDEIGYVATEWRDADGSSVVVLEVHH